MPATPHGRRHASEWLTDAQKERIRRLRQQGVATTDLAARFGVSQRSIYTVLNDRAAERGRGCDACDGTGTIGPVFTSLASADAIAAMPPSERERLMVTCPVCGGSGRRATTAAAS